MTRAVLGITGAALVALLGLTTDSVGQCCGDCNGDDAVTVDEVLTTVNRALTSCSDDGICSMATCPDSANNTTNLLYTYVQNQVGFDTGIAISNTGQDPFRTATVPCPGGTCRCTLNFFGDNAPSPVSSGNMPPGHTYTAVASTLAPNFQGYMIASCNFPYAHGFAFLSDFGARNLAMGYLAQVICSDRSSTAMDGGR